MTDDFSDPVADAQAAGFSVVPADQNKRPKVRWKQWQETAQTEAEFDALGHGSIWGLVTGALYGIAVLDFDFDAGGEETLAALGLEPHVRTPAGAHVYVNHPGYPVKNAARKWDEYPGLDVRGDGGLAWFSGRSKKGVYTPVSWPPEPIDIDPQLVEKFFPQHEERTVTAEFAEWTGTGHGTPEATRYVGRLVEDIITAEPGTSNAVLNKAGYSVGGLIASGSLDEQWAYDRLLAAAEDRRAGEPDVVLLAALETGAASPWKFEPEVDEWVPVAALKLFRQGRIPDPTPFPIDALPAPLDELTRQGSDSVSCPPDFIGTGVLPVLGTAIGGYVDIEITETWRESSLLYTALVGVPSVRKTPAMNLVMQPIYKATSAMRALAKEQAEEDDGSWQEVAPPKLSVNDATIEALFGVLERNPRGVILAPDELDGWVKGMGQYKGGGGRDRQHWLSIWSRTPIDVDRKTTKSHYIEKPFVSIIGGIQPDPLEELLHGKNDGLLPRILMAQGEFVTPRLRRNALDPSVSAGYDALWNRLRDEGMTTRTVEFTPAGYASFESWVNDHYGTLGKLPPELAGAWGKMDGQAARICLILAMVLGTEVTPDVVERAVALVRYFQGQAAGLLRGSSAGSQWEKQNSARLKSLARYIQDHPGAERAELMAHGPAWALDGRLLDRMLETLADMGVWNG